MENRGINGPLCWWAGDVLFYSDTLRRTLFKVEMGLHHADGVVKRFLFFAFQIKCVLHMVNSFSRYSVVDFLLFFKAVDG